MKTFIEHILLMEENEPFALPDYPEQVMSKDDPKGDWVTGDPPKPIDFSSDGEIESMPIDKVAGIISSAAKKIKNERESQKPK